MTENGSYVTYALNPTKSFEMFGFLLRSLDGPQPVLSWPQHGNSLWLLHAPSSLL